MKWRIIVILLVAAACGCSREREHETPVTPMVCLDAFPPGIVVAVRDNVTGLAAACGAQGLAAQGDLVEVLYEGGDCSTDPTGLFLWGVETPGTYTVTVGKPGYHSWVQEGVQVQANSCGVIGTTLNAGLIPM